MSKAVVPFSDAQIDAINRNQNNPLRHPLTCGGDRHDAAHQDYQALHGGDLGQLVATREGLKCPVCDYVQRWVPLSCAEAAPVDPSDF